MKTAVTMPRHRRGDYVRFHLAYAAAFPLFLSAEILQRWLAPTPDEDASEAAARRSIFAAARESTLIAISYALMARTMLRVFPRQNRVERLS
jgi:hypothetical protein